MFKQVADLAVVNRCDFALNVLRTPKTMKLLRRFDKDMPDHKLIVKYRTNNHPSLGKYAFGKRHPKLPGRRSAPR